MAVLRPLEAGGHAVGVVSHASSYQEMNQLLANVIEETEEEEVYLLDESANIIASYPYSKVLGSLATVEPSIYKQSLRRFHCMTSSQ